MVGQSVRVTTISLSHAPLLITLFFRSITSDFPRFIPPGNEAVSLDPQAVVQAIVKTLSSQNPTL